MCSGRDAAGRKSAYVVSPSDVTIDTVNPTDPSSVAFNTTVAGFSTSNTVSITFSESTDLIQFDTHSVKVCTDSSCSTGCISGSDTALSPASVSGLVEGETTTHA